MLLAVLLPFLLAIFLVIPFKKYESLVARTVWVVPAGIFIYFLQTYLSGNTGITGKASLSQIIPYSLQWNLDGLSLLFVLLISGIGTLIFIYGAAYMNGHPYRIRLLGFLSLFMGAMLGLVLSDHVMNLFLFWELTSISSFFLIGFNNEDKASRLSALKALVVTGGGGLILFGGLMLLGQIASTYSIHEMIALQSNIVADPFYPLIMVLIILGAATKSAQFPFHFWLPGAMKAPTPVSAYLHSATMVKAGVYLLARFTPVLGGTEIWQYTLIALGGITMLYAAFHALLRTDLKGILAYSTISALGVMVFLIGIGTEASLLAVGMFILVHALYKAALFLITGIIDHETGSRDISKLRGLRKVMWPVALAGILAAISNAGIPPSLGFMGKDLIYESTLHHVFQPILLTTAGVITNIMLLIAGFNAGWRPFSGQLPSEFSKVHLPEKSMWIPPLLLAVLGLGFGIIPSIIESPLMRDIVLSLHGVSWAGHLALWHGFNTVLLLSGITIVTGIALYFALPLSGKIASKITGLTAISPENIWTLIAKGFNQMAIRITAILQNGFLRFYILIILTFVGILLAYKLSNQMYFTIDYRYLSPVTVYEAIIVGILIVSILFTVFSTSRLVAVASMGVVGMAICMIFVFYSAPDLAMTQFTIDTLTVVLFVLVLYRLPKFIKLTFAMRHIRDGLVSIGFGTLIALLALEVLDHQPDRTVSKFYGDNSYLLAKGKNIVNVIIVDFRGVDTLVEIIVLSIAAIGVFSLLKLRIRKSQKIE